MSHADFDKILYITIRSCSPGSVSLPCYSGKVYCDNSTVDHSASSPEAIAYTLQCNVVGAILVQLLPGL